MVDEVADEVPVPDARAWRTEHRYRAVREVLDGAPVAEVARQYGTSRQALHGWLRRYETEGYEGLAERSRRPKTSPTRLAAELESVICDLRHAHPRWGARRIEHELVMRGVADAPSRTTVYRVLVRNGLIVHQEQNHRRAYRRWQRDAPMQLWQIDIMGGLFLADGRECKLVTGIDDHSRFIVISQVIVEQSGRAVCQAFTDAMGRYGVPAEVLTDNGKQFTGRFTKPFPVEVMFERICRENGILQRLTKPRSPTTTGKIERFHGSLRRELLDDCGPFASIAAAQQAIDAWVHGYNHTRPHQSLNMATPFSMFRPVPGLTAPPPPAVEVAPTPQRVPIPMPVRHDISEVFTATQAVEVDLVISPVGRLSLPALSGAQDIKFAAALGGQPVTVWADLRSIHVLLAGEVIRTRPSKFTVEDLEYLRLRGRPAGTEPAAPAAPTGTVPVGTAIEIERTVGRDGDIIVGATKVKIGVYLAGQRITMRLDRNLAHIIADGCLVETVPAPLTPEQAARMTGAHTATGPLPARRPGVVKLMRTIPADGITQVAGQRLRVGRAHVGKTVTILAEDTVFRVLHNDIEISTHVRKNTNPVTHLRSSPHRTPR